MKLLDANILLYAYDASSAHHGACRAWLEDALNEDEPLGLPWQTSLAFIRISTNARAVRVPLAGAVACGVISALLNRPPVVVPEPGERYWEILVRVIDEARVTGPRITDASLAAVAIEQGAALCSTDRDFRRFPGLRLIDPTHPG